jgi:SAM-dependent methyltransferase
MSRLDILPRPIRRTLKVVWFSGTVAIKIAKNTLARVAPRAMGTIARLATVSGRGKGYEGAAAARYFHAVANDYEILAEEIGLVAKGRDLFRDRTVLEIGPGNTRSIGLLSKLRGAKAYEGVDGYDVQARTENYLRTIYEPLLSLEGEEGGHARATVLLEGTRIHVGNESLRRTDRRFDLVVSRAVLEHVRDLDALYATLRDVTTDDAILIHKVDLRSHGIRFDTELDFLIFPDSLFRLMSSHSGDMPNRVRAPGYLELGARHGFSLMYAGATHVVSRSHVESVKSRMAPPYRDMPDSVLAVLGVWLVQVGPSHPFAKKGWRDLRVDALPRAPIEKLAAF